MCEDDRRLDDYFEIFKDLIIRYAKSYVGDYYIAEDICQETFIRFGEHQDEIRESSAKFWLMKTAKNIALDYLRKNKNRVPVIDLDTALDMLSEDPFSDVSWILEEKEKSEFLKRALFRMKIEHNNWYEVILMSYVQRMDNISIGNEFGVSACSGQQVEREGTYMAPERLYKEEQNESGDETSPD